MTVDASTVGRVQIQVQGADDVRAGELARLRFLVTVPEFQRTDIAVAGSGFISDSLQFLDVVPTGLVTPFVTGGQCNLTVLKFSTPAPSSIRIMPQPVSDDATVTFVMQENVPVVLRVMDAQGVPVKTLLDGSQRLLGGEYEAHFSVKDLASGTYHLRISAGVFSATLPFVVVR